MGRKGADRSAEPMGLGSYLEGESARIVAGASAEQREVYQRVDETRKVIDAWNRVCAGTREGEHVTGLYYAAQDNALIAYVDDPVWVQELMMLREIIRARMERYGVSLSSITFKLNQHERSAYVKKAKLVDRDVVGENPAPHSVQLSSEQERALAGRVEDIEDEGLKGALYRAMHASLSYSSSADSGESEPRE